MKSREVRLMRDISVTFDERRGGYVAERLDAPAVSALSLIHLRRRLEQAEGGAVRLQLDLRARRERDRRRDGGHGGPQQWR
jgi:hypothetical protein